MNSKIVQNRAI